MGLSLRITLKNNALAECAGYERVSKLGVCDNFCFSAYDFGADTMSDVGQSVLLGLLFLLFILL